MRFTRGLPGGRKLLIGCGLLILGAVATESTHAQWRRTSTPFRRQVVVYSPTVLPQSTGVWVNGRPLTPYQVMLVRQRFGYVLPGHFWLRSDGTFGLVGRPAMGNLFTTGRSTGGSRRRRSLLSGSFLTGGSVIGNAGAIYRGSSATFGR